MNKKIYLSILTIVTIAAIILGVCIHILSPIGRWFGKDHTSDDLSAAATTSETLDAFDSISIDTNVSDITITTGDDYSIRYQASEQLIPQYAVSEGTLTISQPDVDTDIIHLGISKTKCDITITLPEDAALSLIQADVNVGELTVQNLNFDTFDCSQNVSETTVSNCTINSLTVDSSTGTITVKDTTFTNGDLSTSTGEIEVEDATFTTLKAKASTGDVDIASRQSLDDYTIELSTSVGDVEMNDHSYKDGYHAMGSGSGKLEASTSTGDVTVTY